MREHDFELLKTRLVEIKKMGWVKNQRPGNIGGIGNTLEDLLDVAENSLQAPDFGAWELKSQRANTGSLLTLFHCEPEPRNARVVRDVLLPLYGWPHQEAGTKYPADEKSFRQTISTDFYSERGFMVHIDRKNQRIFVSFDYSRIHSRHSQWRSHVRTEAGTGDIRPTPYWTFAEIEGKLNTKLKNLMYVKAETKRIQGEEFFRYNQIEAYIDPMLDRFLKLLGDGLIFVDFDARTGHNHGTKFRIRPEAKNDLYQQYITV